MTAAKRFQATIDDRSPDAVSDTNRQQSPTLRAQIATARRRAVAWALIAATAVGLTAASQASADLGASAFDGGAYLLNGDPATQAGSHPQWAETTFTFTETAPDLFGWRYSTEDPRQIRVDLPAGFVGGVHQLPACSDYELGHNIWNGIPVKLPPSCPIESQVGWIETRLNGHYNNAFFDPLYNMKPPKGVAALFGLNVSTNLYHFAAGLRADPSVPGGYRVSVVADNVPQTLPLRGSRVRVWGVPPDPDNDVHRGVGADNAFGTACGIRPGSIADCANSPTNSTAPLLPVLTLPPTCVGPVETDLIVTGWQGGSGSASFLSHDNATPPNPIGNDGCENVPFTPTASIEPSSTARGGATGLDARITVPEDVMDPEGVSQSHLDKTVVELPEGLSVNPSAATGLAACTDEQLSLGTDDEPSCPDASRIGTAEVISPLLAERVKGVVVLRTPKSTDPESGEMFRMAIIARNRERGILVKLPGVAVADSRTGRLTATFDDNPQLPFSDLEVSINGGSRGVLALPQDCGEIESKMTLTPWTVGPPPVISFTPATIGGDCAPRFAPKLAAGMDDPRARASGKFSFRFSREDGEQWVDGLTAKLPSGLLASVKGFPLCSDGQAAVGGCPEASRIGTVDAAAGSGDPFVLERKGTAYLTEGYKGCAYGLLVSVPVVAGPFDGSSLETDLGSINVRQAVCVDRSTAEVTATSDPLPTIWHGIPVRTRSVTVLVDRPDFMLNPSGCGQKQVGATFGSDRGATASATSGFAASGCSSLAFKPKLTLALSGRRQVRTGKHPGVRAQVTQQGVGEAGIEKAVVRLPKSLALDVNNAQALCEYVDGTKPDLENHCPKGSIVGRARAVTPLLNDPLVGNVYFVKNVRRDPRTGNQIRTLPMIVVALRGEIAVNLKGESDTTRAGKLVNTFNQVPDAPISRFNLNIQGGKNGILAVTRTRRANINLCAKPRGHIAEADMDGHNGRRHDTDIRMKTPCSKRQTKAAKRQAKRAAKARNAHG